MTARAAQLSINSLAKGRAVGQHLRAAILQEMKAYPGHRMILTVYPKSSMDQSLLSPCNECEDEYHVHAKIDKPNLRAERNVGLAYLTFVGGLGAALLYAMYKTYPG